MTKGSGDGPSRRQGDVASERHGAEPGRAQEQDAAAAPSTSATAPADTDSADADAGSTTERSTDREAQAASVQTDGLDEQEPEPRTEVEPPPGPERGATALEPEPASGPSEPEPEPGPTARERDPEPEAARGPASHPEPEPEPEPNPEAARGLEPDPQPEPAKVVEPDPDPQPGAASDPDPDQGRQPELAPDAESGSLSEPRVQPTTVTPSVPDSDPEQEPTPSLFESPAPPRAVPPPLPMDMERPPPDETQVVDLTTVEPPEPAEPREEAAAADNRDSTVVVITDRTVREPDEPEWESPPPLPAPESVPAYMPPTYVAPASAGTAHTPGGGRPEYDSAADPPGPPGTGGVPLVEDIPGGWQAVKRRHRRQTATFLVALLGVLGLGALAGLMYTGRVAWPFGGRVNVSAQVCTPSKPVAPKQIHVRVYNGSNRAGLAKTVGAQLKALGFVVQETGNDPLEAKVTTAVEIRYGDAGELAGKTAAAYFAGKIRQRLDDRTNEVVDVVLGPKFSRVHTRQEANRALVALRPKLPLSCPPGVTPTPTPTPSATPSKKAGPTPTPTPKH